MTGYLVAIAAIFATLEIIHICWPTKQIFSRNTRLKLLLPKTILLGLSFFPKKVLSSKNHTNFS